MKLIWQTIYLVSVLHASARFRYVIVLILLLGCYATAQGQPVLSALDILERSIAYHDASGLMGTVHFQFAVKETRPNGRDRRTVIDLDAPNGRFGMYSEREGHEVEATIQDGTCTATLDGSSEIPGELQERYRLTCDGIQWLRDYYGYLLSLPMKLRDPGTQLEKEATKTTFAERIVETLKVTYEEGVGSDVWYFYFDPATYALVGCRFYHDESKNDGEYIVFEGEVEQAGLRLPQTRHWYTNAEGTFLGADTIETIEQIASSSVRNQD